MADSDVEVIEDGDGDDIVVLEETNTVVSQVQQEASVSAPIIGVKRKHERESVGGDTSLDEGETCSICFEPYTTTGAHRVNVLRCGHVFGKRCIERWFNETRPPSCPQCKRKINKKREVFVVYTRGIRAVDTRERDELAAQLEAERAERRRVELALAETRLKLQACVQLNQELRQQPRQQQQVVQSNRDWAPVSKPQGTVENVRLRFKHKVEICRNGECRVMAASAALRMLVCSQLNANPLHPGYGFRKVDIADGRATEFIAVHTQLIRDITFSPNGDGLILSASADKTLRLTSAISGAKVHSWELPMQAWSCAWNRTESQYVFAGLQNGSIRMYDTRMMFAGATQGGDAVDFVSELVAPGSTMPVHSLFWVDEGPGVSGVLAGYLNRCIFHKHDNLNFEPNLLPLQGSLTSLNYCTESHALLASFRPSTVHPLVQHELCKLVPATGMPGIFTTEHNASFTGGYLQSKLSRSAFIPASTHDLRHVAAYDEEASAVKIWNSSTSNVADVVRCDEYVLDILSCQLPNIKKNMTCFLTARSVAFYESM